MSDNKNKETWLKSFRFSMRRATKNAFKSYAPAISNTTDSILEMGRDMRKFSSKVTQLNRRHMQELSKTKMGKSAQQIFNTAMNDMKTGNFSKPTTDDLFDSYGDDISSSFDIDFESPEYSEKSSDEILLAGSEGVAKTVIASGAAQIEGMQSMAKAIMGSNIKSSQAMAASLSNTFIHSTNIMNRSLLSINNHLATMNENITSLLEFHNNNTNSMYETLNEFTSKSVDMLDQMGKMMSSMSDYVEGKEAKQNRKFSIYDGFNIKEYLAYAKEGLAKSTPKMFYDMFTSMGGMDRIKKDPIGLIVEQAIKTVIPKNIEKTVKTFNDNLNEYLTEALNRIGDINPARGDFGLMMLGLDTIFKGIGNDRAKRKSYLSMGSYHKEALPWNGIAQKSITEVIPEYLSSIDASITHISKILSRNSKINPSNYDIKYKAGNKRYYDYESGQFKKLEKIVSDFEYDIESSYQTSELSDALDKALALIPKEGKKDKFKNDFTNLYNDIISNQISDKKFTEQVSKMLYMLRREDENTFKRAIMDIKKSVEEGNIANNELLERISSTQDIYRNINNTYDKSIYDRYASSLRADKKISPFGILSGYGDSGYSEAKQKILESLDRLEETLKFEKNSDAQSFYRSIQNDKALLKKVFNSELQYSELDNYIYEKWKSKYGKSLFDKFKRNISDKFLEKTGLSKFTNNFSDSVADMDNTIFRFTYGINKADPNDLIRGAYDQQIKRGSKLSNYRYSQNSPKSLIDLATSPQSAPAVLETVLNNIVEQPDEKRAVNSKFKSNVIKGKKLQDRVLSENNRLTFNKSSKMNFKEVKLSQKKIDGVMDSISELDPAQTLEESIIQSNNTMVITLGSLMGTFKNYNTSLLGKDGRISKMINDQIGFRIKERIFDDLFDEEKGFFKDQVKGFKEKANNLRERTTTRFKALYKKGYKYTMQTAFGEDYKENENWKKYARWASIDKEDKNNEKKEKGYISKFKEQAKRYAPSIASAGIIGAVIGGPLVGGGALFLPSTLIGGAIAASGLSILSKTEAMQSVLFGKKGEDDKRVGGLISAEAAAKMKKALPFVVGGATLGVLRHLIMPGATSSAGSAFGVFGASLLPTGIIGAALLGSAIALAKNSDTVKDILFGKMDPETNKRSGGPVPKIINSLNTTFHKLAPVLKSGVKGLAIGSLAGISMSGMGLIPAAIAGGPIGIGLLGLGAGLLSTSKKFQTFMFGDEILDKDGNPTGKRTSGLLTRAANLVKVNFVDKIGSTFHDNLIKFVDWAKIKMLVPFKQAFGPILDSLMGIKNNIVDFVKEKFDAITDGIHRLVEGTLKKLFSPLAKLVRGFIGISGTLMRNAVQLKLLPITLSLKALQFLSSGQRRKAMKDYYLDYWKQLPQFLSGKWQMEREMGKNVAPIDQIVDVVKAYMGKGEIADASRKSYNELMGGMGYNHLGWRDSYAVDKAYRADRKRHNKEIKMWNKVSNLGANLGKEFGWRDNIELTDAKIADVRKRLKRFGINPEAIKNSEDVMNLIYRIDDFKKNYNEKFGFKKEGATIEDIARGEGIKINDPEADKFREKVLDHQEVQKAFYATVSNIMSDSAFDRTNKLDKYADDPERQRRYINMKAKRAKRLGVDINELDYRSLGFLDEDLLDDDFFNEYRNSDFYKTGDFIGFAKRRQKIADRDKSIKAADNIKNRQKTIKRILKENDDERVKNEERIIKLKEVAANKLNVNANNYNIDKALEDGKLLPILSVAKEMKDLLARNNKLAEESNSLEKESAQNLEDLKSIGDVNLRVDTEGGITLQDIQKRRAVKKNGILKSGKFNIPIKSLDKYKLTEEEQKENYYDSIKRFFTHKDERDKDDKVKEGAKSIATRAKDKIVKTLGGPASFISDKAGKGLNWLEKAVKSPLGSKIAGFAKAYLIASGIAGVLEVIKPGTHNKMIAAGENLGFKLENHNIYDEYILPMIGTIFTKIGDGIRNLAVKFDQYWEPHILPAISAYMDGFVRAVPKLVEVFTLAATKVLPAVVEAGVKVIPTIIGSLIEGAWNGTIGTWIPFLRISTNKAGNVTTGVKQANAQDRSITNIKDDLAEEERLKLTKGTAARYDEKTDNLYTANGYNIVGINENGEAVISDGRGGGATWLRAARNAVIDTLKEKPGKLGRWGRLFFKGTAGAIGSVIGGAVGGGLGIGSRLMTAGLGGGSAIKMAKAGAEFGAKLPSNIVKYADKGLDAITNRKAINQATKEYMSKFMSKAAGKTSKNIVSKAVSEADDKTIQFIVKKIKTAGKDLSKMSKVVAKVTDLCGGDDKVAMKVIKEMEKMCEVIAKELPQHIAKNPQLGKSLIKEALAKISKGASKFIPYANVAFMLYDFTSGVLEADRLFGVPSYEVDGTMRVVSGVMKFLLGLGSMVLVDLVLEIADSFSGVDYKQKIAGMFYKVLTFGNIEKIEKLKNLQDISINEANEYNAATGASLSVSEFNKMKNKTVWQKMTGWISKSKAQKEFDKNYRDYKNMKSNGWTMPTETESVGRGKGKSKPMGFGKGINTQGNSKWAKLPIGTMPDGSVSTMETGGCGPTSLANVANRFGVRVTPGDVGQYASSHGYISQGGANEKLFTEGASKLGLKSTKLNSSRDIVQSLASNRPTIISGVGRGNTPFTDAGHIVVGRGFDNRGKMIIEDPMDGKLKSYIPNDVLKNVTGGWAYGYGIRDRGDSFANTRLKRYKDDSDKPVVIPEIDLGWSWGKKSNINFVYVMPKDSSKGYNGISTGKYKRFAGINNGELYEKFLNVKNKKPKRFKKWEAEAYAELLRARPKYKHSYQGNKPTNMQKKKAKRDNKEWYDYQAQIQNDKFFETRNLIERILKKEQDDNKKKLEAKNAKTIKEIKAQLDIWKNEDQNKFNRLKDIAVDQYKRINSGDPDDKYIYDFIKKWWDKGEEAAYSHYNYTSSGDIDFNPNSSFSLGYDKDSVLGYLRASSNMGFTNALMAFKSFFVGMTRGMIGQDDMWTSAAKEIESYENSKIRKSMDLDEYGGYAAPSTTPFILNSEELKVPKELQISMQQFNKIGNRKKRIEYASKFANIVATKASVPPSLLYAIGSIESGFGDIHDGTDPIHAHTNSLFAMKIGKDNPYNLDIYRTSDGRNFAKFDNVGDSIAYFGHFLQNGYYNDALRAQTPERAMRAIANSYVVGPNGPQKDKDNYYNTLMSLYNSKSIPISKYDDDPLYKDWKGVPMGLGIGYGPGNDIIDAFKRMGQAIVGNSEKGSFANSIFAKYDNTNSYSASESMNFNMTGGKNIPPSINISENSAAGYVQRALGGARISSPFGARLDPFGSGKTVQHGGIDFATKTGTKIYTPVSGVVTRSEGNKSYGNLVVIKDSAGYNHYFAHQNRIYASKGDKVSRGSVIGEVGSTGNSTGPHLHYEIRKPDGKNKINPKDYYTTSLGYGNPILNKDAKVRLADLDIGTRNMLKKYDLDSEDSYYGTGGPRAAASSMNGSRTIVNNLSTTSLEAKLDLIADIMRDWKKSGTGNNINIVNSGNTSNNINNSPTTNNLTKTTNHQSAKDIKNKKLEAMYEILSAI